MAEVYRDIFVEGYAMAYTSTDFLRLLGYEAKAVVSRSLEGFFPRERSVYVDPQRCVDDAARIAKDFDFVALIAPPKQLVEIAKALDTPLLQPEGSLLETLSNKYRACEVLRECGISTPKTVVVDGKSVEKVSKVFGNRRVVVKPPMSTGSECVFIGVGSDADKAVLKALSCSHEDSVVVQEYVGGVHGSITAFYGYEEPLLYSVNLQLIELFGDSIRFVGGLTPIRLETLVSKAYEVVHRLGECLRRVKGFVGLDFVWNGRDIVVVEINPRITTSIVAINTLLKRALGETQHGVLSDKPVYVGSIAKGYSYYVKTSPSIYPLADEHIFKAPFADSALVVGYSDNISMAIERVLEFSKNLIYDLRRFMEIGDTL